MSPVQDQASAPHWSRETNAALCCVTTQKCVLVTLPGGVVAFRQKHRASLSLLDSPARRIRGGISHCTTKENVCQAKNVPSCVRFLLRLSRDMPNRLLGIFKRVYDDPVHIFFSYDSPITKFRIPFLFTSESYQDP